MENLSQADSMLFRPLTAGENTQYVGVRPAIGYWSDVWSRIKGNKIAFVSMVCVLIVLLASIFVPLISPYDYRTCDLPNSNASPSPAHFFGTDILGRDLFVRVFSGAGFSLVIAFSAALINLVIGVVYGGVAGFAGGKTDAVLMRFVDALSAIPMMIYIIILMTVIDLSFLPNGDIITIVLALCISHWIEMARIVRGEVLALKQQEFVLASRALGVSDAKILFRHLIPNCFGSILVTITLLIPQAIFAEAFLSFVGLGISAPKASLGTLANDAMSAIYTYPSQLFFSTSMICIIILSFNLFADGLRDALDPKMKR